MAGAEPQDGAGAQCLQLVPCPGCAEVSNWQQELVSPSWHHQLLPPKPVPEKHMPPGLDTAGAHRSAGQTLEWYSDTQGATLRQRLLGVCSHASAWPSKPCSASEDVGEPKGFLEREGVLRACTSIIRGQRDQAGSAQCVMCQVHHHHLRSLVWDTPDAECAFVRYQQLMDKTICAEQTLTKGKPHTARCLLSPQVHVCGTEGHTSLCSSQ